MRYVSTRSRTEAAARDVLLGALAPDGGLYLPVRWPRLSEEEAQTIANGSYADALATVVPPFLDEEAAARLKADAGFAARALARFRHPAVAPLYELGPDLWLLELFHGPTFSFKDYGLQPLARLAADILGLGSDGARRLIIGATSGDTGSAALAAFAGMPGVEAVILFPDGRISEVQRRQMTTIAAANVHCVAVSGSFDDAQRLAKRALAHLARAGVPVLAVNSINWGRILFQSIYYQWTARRLAARTGRPVRFVVPSGNFGNAFAAILAWRMGAPVAGLLLATNSNDALVRAVQEGRLSRAPVRATLSPAMDIQVPSNLERLLALETAEPERTAALMQSFERTGRLTLPAPAGSDLGLAITAAAVDDEATLAAIRAVHGATDRILCPHTAVGFAARARVGPAGDAVDVLVATAHPAKFPDAVRRAIGTPPVVPPALAAALEGEERLHRLPAEETALVAFLERLVTG